MTCFHGLGSSVQDYVIYETHILKRITKFELLNSYDPNYDYMPLSLTLNLVIHTIHTQETGESKRHTWFDRSNVGPFLRNLGSLTYNNTI